ncbi:hypothetical protein R1sor_003072 [Riccia sorocarpa]|uniref:Prefoldin subunit 1 n=1 Tax=Riccia sorocarpa TaxID=122646 RepID=A0ABD3H0I7_9MARC
MKEEDSASKKEQLSSQVQKLEVACVELASLPSGRTVYEKKGNLFFRTDAKMLNTSQQRELKRVKSRMDKL